MFVVSAQLAVPLGGEGFSHALVAWMWEYAPLTDHFVDKFTSGFLIAWPFLMLVPVKAAWFTLGRIIPVQKRS